MCMFTIQQLMQKYRYKHGFRVHNKLLQSLAYRFKIFSYVHTWYEVSLKRIGLLSLDLQVPEQMDIMTGVGDTHSSPFSSVTLMYLCTSFVAHGFSEIFGMIRLKKFIFGYFYEEHFI